MEQVVIERNIEAERQIKSALKARVKELAAQGKAIRVSMAGTAGPERDGLWNDKREVGVKARHWLLAYGMFKGKRYAQIEPKTRTRPNEWDILGNLVTVQGAAIRLIPREKQIEAIKTIRAWLEGTCMPSADETLNLGDVQLSSVTPSENSPSDTQNKSANGIGPRIRSFFSKLIALPPSTASS